MNLSYWLTRHAQNAIGALGLLSRNPVATLLTALVIGIALALPAALSVAVQAGRAMGGHVAETREFSVYLEPGVGLERAEALATELQEKAAVARVQVVSAEQAVRELSTDEAFAAALAALERNPLPHTLVVRPAEAATPADIEALAAGLRGQTGVGLVQLDAEWVVKLNAILDVVRRIATLLGILLVAAVVIIVGNTIRLDIQNRSAEIEVAKLLGATDAFVRRPFLYLGLWYGILGGLVAGLILLLGLAVLRGPVLGLAGAFGAGDLPAEVGLFGPLITVLAGGLLAGWGGAWLAVGRHLAAVQPNV